MNWEEFKQKATPKQMTMRRIICYHTEKEATLMYVMPDILSEKWLHDVNEATKHHVILEWLYAQPNAPYNRYLSKCSDLRIKPATEECYLGSFEKTYWLEPLEDFKQEHDGPTADSGGTETGVPS